jgi:hypothetical protein
MDKEKHNKKELCGTCRDMRLKQEEVLKSLEGKPLKSLTDEDWQNIDRYVMPLGKFYPILLEIKKNPSLIPTMKRLKFFERLEKEIKKHKEAKL